MRRSQRKKWNWNESQSWGQRWGGGGGDGINNKILGTTLEDAVASLMVSYIKTPGLGIHMWKGQVLV